MAKAETTNNNRRVLADKTTTKNGTQPAFTRKPRAEGEELGKMQVLDENRVLAPFTLKENGKATEQYVFNTTFDFSACTREDLLVLAMRSARIVFQRQLREKWHNALHNEHTMVDVKTQIVDAERSQADNNARLIGLLMREKGWTRERAVAFVEAE